MERFGETVHLSGGTWFNNNQPAVSSVDDRLKLNAPPRLFSGNGAAVTAVLSGMLAVVVEFAGRLIILFSTDYVNRFSNSFRSKHRHQSFTAAAPVPQRDCRGATNF